MRFGDVVRQNREELLLGGDVLHIQNNTLKFEFPEVHRDAVVNISFHRTTAVGFQSETSLINKGTLPLFYVDDYSHRLPSQLLKRVGIIAPAEKEQPLYVTLSGNYPFAVKIGVGKINAVSGCPWSEQLNADDQDYLITSLQSTFAGYHEGSGAFHQFVATPLGQKNTVEEEVTGTAHVGGIQIITYPMKRMVYEDYCRNRAHFFIAPPFNDAEPGVGKGPLIQQETVSDTYASNVWEMGSSHRCFVHLLEKRVFWMITGRDNNGHSAKIFSLDWWRNSNEG